MWIVTMKDNTRHSAWNSRRLALKQAKVLESYGYCVKRGKFGVRDAVSYDATVSCENGHYLV